MFNLIDNVSKQLRILPAFSGFDSEQLQVVPLQTLDHSEVYRVRLPDKTSLILKRAGVSAGDELAIRERRFYESVAPLLPDGLVPKCVFVVDEPSGWLAITDVADTYLPSVDISTPSREECTQLVRALAVLHGTSIRSSDITKAWSTATRTLPKAGIDQRIAMFLEALDPFLHEIGTRLDKKERQLVSSLSGVEEKFSRVSAVEMNILVHGDAHFSNFLYSEDAGACIIDWALPMISFGEIDLAHALALNLPRRIGREWEADLLNQYAAQLRLLSCPVDDERVEQRYNLAVLYGFVSPVLWWKSSVPEEYWWPGFTNVLDAALDRGLLK